MPRTISAFGANLQARDGQDIRLDERGNLAMAVGLEDVRQRVLERLRYWLAQWFLTVEDGVPYRPEIFQQTTTVGLAAAVVSNQIRSVEGVTGVGRVIAEIDPVTRRMTYSALVSTTQGDTEIGETVG